MGHKRHSHKSKSSSSKRQELSSDDDNPFEPSEESSAVVQDSDAEEEKVEEPKEEEDADLEEDLFGDKAVSDEDAYDVEDVPPEEEEEVVKVEKKKPGAKKPTVIEMPADDIDIDLAKEALTCPLCCKQYTYPVVNCKGCQNYPVCHSCLEAFAKAKNGGTATPPCPKCKRVGRTPDGGDDGGGFEESRYHNSIIGQKLVHCKNQHKGCTDKPCMSQLETHLDKYCRFTSVNCKNNKFGCPWKDIRSKLAAHEDLCQLEKAALRIRKREEEFKALNDKVLELQRGAEAAVRTVEAALKRGTSLLRTEADIDFLQKKSLAQFKQISSFNKIRKLDTVTVQLHNGSRKPINLNIEITLGEHKFYTLSIFTDDIVPRFPLTVAGYILPQDAAISAGSAGVVPFGIRFTQAHEKFIVFQEVDAFTINPSTPKEELEQILEVRDQFIKFAAVGCVLWPNEKRA
jgi:hypothetical protein